MNAAKWLVAELVRIFHQVDVATATEFVEALIERDTPAVWEVVPGTKRVLNTKMTVREKVLLLLHSTPGPVKDDVLRGWAEYSNATRFRKEILGGLHDDKLVVRSGPIRTHQTSPRSNLFQRNTTGVSLNSSTPFKMRSFSSSMESTRM